MGTLYGSAMKKKGRPKKTASSKLAKKLRIGATAHQKKSYERVADENGMDLSVWVRITLDAAVKAYDAAASE